MLQVYEKVIIGLVSKDPTQSFIDNYQIQLIGTVSSSYLFELQFRVNPHVADLTVEGSLLSVGVHRPPSLLSTGFGAQARIRLDGTEPTSCLQDSFVFGTCRQEGANTHTDTHTGQLPH